MPSKVYNGLRKSFKKNEFMIITNYHICIKQILLFNKLQLLDIDSNLFNIEIQFSNVLWFKIIGFQFNNHIRFQPYMIKQHIQKI